MFGDLFLRHFLMTTPSLFSHALSLGLFCSKINSLSEIDQQDRLSVFQLNIVQVGETCTELFALHVALSRAMAKLNLLGMPIDLRVVLEKPVISNKNSGLP